MSQTPTFAQHTQVDPDDLDKNPNTDAPHLRDLIEARLNRRHVLKGGVGAMTMAGLGTLGLAAADDAQAISGNANDAAKLAVGVTPATELQFTALTKSILDGVRIAPEFDVRVIYATGDSISPDVPEYVGNGEEMQYDRRAGDHHDGMHFFPLDKKGRRDDDSSAAGLLAVNHENISGTAQFLHPQGETNASGTTIQLGGTAVRPPAQVIKEQDAHGVSIVEMRRDSAGGFARNKASRYNRHVTARTTVEINGPARGSKYMKTKRFPSGLQARGTLNNCGHGVTPWGTYLTAEENWAGYFVRRASDRRDDRTEAAFQRNGLRPNQAGFAHRRWASVSPGDVAAAGLDMSDFERWDTSIDTSIPGATATDDYRNEFNTFGFIVEIDPYDPLARPRKRTALGRRANEGCWSSIPKAGKPLAFYIGCDSRNEYVYKYVSDARWVPADGKKGGLAVGDKYLDKGTIYSAVFDADGTGRWEPLTMSNPKVAAGAKAIVIDPVTPPTSPPTTKRTDLIYTFEDLADICVNTRLAAGAVGATRMDRPEWTAVNPFNGEIYITMTENPDRGNINGLSSNNVPNPDVDAANPRYWTDTKAATSQGAAAVQRGNVNGHIVRIRETGDDPDALTFTWDIFLFGAQAAADAGPDNLPNDFYQKNVNISGLSPLNDLSKPDGCWFSPTTGILYIQTDDNTFTDQTNAQLLAVIPGRVGDGRAVDIVNAASGSPDAGVREAGQDKVVSTYAGKPLTDATFKRILTGPLGAEITGLTETPDGKVLFVNVQHPGENTGRSGAVPPSTALTPTALNGPFESNWPANGLGDAPAYGPGGQTARPRSATLMITRKDGRVIGFDARKNKGKDKDDRDKDDDRDDKGRNG